MFRICYLFDQGFMVETASLQKMREKKYEELRDARRRAFKEEYGITDKEEAELAECGKLTQSQG